MLSGTIVLELGAQAFAGEKYAALDCAEGEIELLGDLVVFVSGHEHVERLAVFLRERVERHRNLLHGV